MQHFQKKKKKSNTVATATELKNCSRLGIGDQELSKQTTSITILSENVCVRQTYQHM